MNPDFRSRVLLPILLPLGVLLAFVVSVLLIALMLLHNTHYGALALAALAAGGILFTVALATSRNRLDTGRRVAVLVAAALPFVGGGLVALDVVGGVDDADRNINTQPMVVAVEGAPTIAAENSTEFCLLDDADTCTPVDIWDIAVADSQEPVTFTFENLEEGVPHNVVFSTLEGDEADPQPGDDILESELITGPDVDTFTDESLTWDDLGDQWYFFCRVHPNMNGVAQLAAG